MQMNSQTTPSSRNGPAWWLAALLILISVLTYTPGSCLDHEAILKGLRDRNVDTRRRTLESRELVACYSSDADEQSCPPNPELFRKINDELIRLLIDLSTSRLAILTSSESSRHCWRIVTSLFARMLRWHSVRAGLIG